LGDRVSTIEVDAFLAEGLLVTIQHGHIPPLESLMDDAVRQANGFEGGPDRMLARLATAVTAPFLRLLDSLEDRIEKIEDRAIARDPSVIAEVQVLRSDVTHLRRLVAPQRDVLLALAREGATPLVTRRARQRFADGYEQVVRTVEQLDGARLLLAAALDTYRSTVAEDMNQVMKVLTVFSAIMLPLTLLAGIWGMNFRFMPELDEPWGYGLALGTMALLGLSMWRWFARRGFVGGPRLEQLPKTIGLGLLEMAALPLWGFERAFRSITDDGGDADSEAAGGDDRAEARER
jgi:magnesium transporter